LDDTIFYIGFDYNCKVECDLVELTAFFNSLKLDEEPEIRESLELGKNVKSSGKHTEELE
jgi:hypothetical protein